jgi:hypothetical protein
MIITARKKAEWLLNLVEMPNAAANRAMIDI